MLPWCALDIRSYSPLLLCFDSPPAQVTVTTHNQTCQRRTMLNVKSFYWIILRWGCKNLTHWILQCCLCCRCVLLTLQIHLRIPQFIVWLIGGGCCSKEYRVYLLCCIYCLHLRSGNSVSCPPYQTLLLYTPFRTSLTCLLTSQDTR